jgi:hypothetical protein
MVRSTSTIARPTAQRRVDEKIKHQLPTSIRLDFSFWIFAKVSLCQIFYQLQNPCLEKSDG